MATSQQDNLYVKETAELAKVFVGIYGKLIINQAKWTNVHQKSLTQDKLDANSGFGGLATQEVSDGTDALSAIKDLITDQLPALLILAGLADG